jgi:uncharacterized protein DUF4136
MSSRKLSNAVVVMICLVVAGISANAQKVKVASDPAVDLSKYKTYAWSSGLPGANPVVNQQIIAAVDSQLAAKGLTKVETDPELTLSAWVWTESDMHVANPSWAPALNSIQTGVPSGSQGWAVTKGTLVIDISDTKSKNGVWRGTASDTLKHPPTGNKAKDAKSVEKPIQKAVEKMFKQFPKPSR